MNDQKEWECFYCDKGVVTSLPSKCPECGVELKKPWREMDSAEQTEAFLKKHPELGHQAIYYLAS